MNRRLAAQTMRLASPLNLLDRPVAGTRSSPGVCASVACAFPIVIIDPQTLFRRGLGLLVRQWQSDATVLEAADIDQALADMGPHPVPKVLLVDAETASQQNFAGLDRLIARLPKTPIILLAGEPDWNTAAIAVEMGARGYIPKATSEEGLRHALAQVASAKIYLPREFATNRAATNGLPTVTRPPTPSRPLRRLTARQLEVLGYLAQGRSNKEIARCLGLFESTVKVHVKTILQKLAAANRTQAAMLAVEMGWARRSDA